MSYILYKVVHLSDVEHKYLPLNRLQQQCIYITLAALSASVCCLVISQCQQVIWASTEFGGKKREAMARTLTQYTLPISGEPSELLCWVVEFMYLLVMRHLCAIKWLSLVSVSKCILFQVFYIYVQLCIIYCV